MNKNIKIAKELVKLAKDIIGAGNQGKPFMMQKGPYHNNPSNFDAIVPNRYQGEFQRHNKNTVVRNGIPVKDYIYVVTNFSDIFLEAT